MSEAIRLINEGDARAHAWVIHDLRTMLVDAVNVAKEALPGNPMPNRLAYFIENAEALLKGGAK